MKKKNITLSPEAEDALRHYESAKRAGDGDSESFYSALLADWLLAVSQPKARPRIADAQVPLVSRLVH